MPNKYIFPRTSSSTPTLKYEYKQKSTSVWRAKRKKNWIYYIFIKNILHGVPENLTHLVFGLLSLFYLLIWDQIYGKWKLNYWGIKWVLIVFQNLNITGDMEKWILYSKYFFNKKYQENNGPRVFKRLCTFYFLDLYGLKHMANKNWTTKDKNEHS